MELHGLTSAEHALSLYVYTAIFMVPLPCLGTLCCEHAGTRVLFNRHALFNDEQV